MGERERALTYVRGLYASYGGGLRNPRLPHAYATFYQERRRALGFEIEEMQAEGEDGEKMARAWCRIAGLR